MDTPQAPAGPGLALHVALRDRVFWWLTTAFTLNTLAAGAITVHVIPYLLDHGYGAGFVATSAGLIGAMKFPGRLLFAPLEARLVRRYLAALLVLLQAVALSILVLVPSAGGALGFAALFGAASGAGTLARPALLAEYYGSTHYGSINGVLVLFLAGAQALAPVGAGLLYAVFSHYEPVVWILIVILFAAAVAVIQADTSTAQGVYTALPSLKE
jgi:MFS family permease